MSRVGRGTGEQLCLMSTWAFFSKEAQWLLVMKVRFERKADHATFAYKLNKSLREIKNMYFI